MEPENEPPALDPSGRPSIGGNAMIESRRALILPSSSSSASPSSGGLRRRICSPAARRIAAVTALDQAPTPVNDVLGAASGTPSAILLEGPVGSPGRPCG
jgi:hypothetical protein